MSAPRYCAVYDFELMPYALGDVLTWNVQTAIQAEDLGRDVVDVYVCLDERYPASIYQRGMITADNCGLFFHELFGAFGTHPRLGHLFVFHRREELLERLREVTAGDDAGAEVVADYERALAHRDDEAVLNEYFTKYIYFHERINAFSSQHGRIPLLRPSPGCEPDVRGLVERRLAGRRVVPIHVRLRRLDAGYGGEHTYARDSDFLEWYDFLVEAHTRHPEVQFVVLGRLQEKPLELLRLPNVMSVRPLGLGLGHELTLMLHSDFFMGTSSGFAAMVNFSRVPYFITKMNAESCNAYRIRPGARRLPFATDRQLLVYEPETRALLRRLLEQGLRYPAARTEAAPPAADARIDVPGWMQERAQWLHPAATTGRFALDDTYADKETAFLVWPRIEEAQAAWSKGLTREAATLVGRLEARFPRLCEKYPEFLRLRALVALDQGDTDAVGLWASRLRGLDLPGEDQTRFLALLAEATTPGRNGGAPGAASWPTALARRIGARRQRQKLLEELTGLLARIAAPPTDA